MTRRIPHTYDTRRPSQRPKPLEFYTPRVLGRRYLRFRLTISCADHVRIRRASAHGRFVQVVDTVTGVRYRVRSGMDCGAGCSCDAVAEVIR
jgi:hypothetical protein